MKDKEFKIKDYQNITIDFQNCNFLSKMKLNKQLLQKKL